MAEGGLKGSLSAEGINKRVKPGKLSSDLLSTFESEPSLARPHSLPVDRFPGSAAGRLSGQSFTSSSEEVMVSQENLKVKKAGVTIKVPEQEQEHISPCSTDEDMLSDSEALEEKGKKKRKSRWKWSPFKKMRKLFRRKKSPTRAKSCEELPVERYKPTKKTAGLEVDDSLRNRAKSEPSLADSRPPLTAADVNDRRNTGDRLVQRTRSEPSRQLAMDKLLKGLKKKGKSQEDIGEEPATPPLSSDERESRTDSMTGLDWTMISSDSGTEAAVSFEALPSASSLEGLHVAHDKIKVAPKHRRPPSRAQSKSSSMNLKKNAIKPHRRSKTDPREMLTKHHETENEEVTRSNRNSDVVNKTIYEAPEAVDEPSKESVVADMKAKASEILSKVRESPRLSESREEKKADTGDKKDTESGELKESQTVKPSTDVKEKSKEIEKLGSEESTDKTSLVKDKSEGNKENKMELRSVTSENKEEETRNGETILKELNGVKDGTKPFLDKSKRSKSLKNFEEKDKTTESTNSTSQQVKPVLRKGLSLSSIGQCNIEPTGKDSDAKPKIPAEKEQINRVSSEEKTKGDQSQAVTPKEVTSNRQEPNTVHSTVSKTNSTSDESRQEVKLREKPPVKQEESESGQPSWIELANRRSKRYSQLLVEGDNQGSQESDSKVTTKVSTNSSDNTNKATVTVVEKPKIASKPSGVVSKSSSLGPVHSRSKTYNGTENKAALFRKSLSEDDPSQDKAGSPLFRARTAPRVSGQKESDSKLITDVSSSPQDNKNKPNVTDKPQIATKPSGVASKKDALGAVNSKNKTLGETEKRAPFRKSMSEEGPRQDKAGSSFRGRAAPLEKCVVCGTTVYQMEKCNFDNSVFHRQCIKCSVCKRLLTVGNFVVSESKVYCKPHGQAVTVSM